MAEGLNRVTLIGNIGQEPELRHTQSGQAILNLRMATSESWVDRDGERKERKERTEWSTVVIWGKRGEALGKFLEKGSKLCVEGRLQTRSWEDKSGNKRYTTEVVATNIVLLGGGGGRSSQQSQGPGDEYAPAPGGGPGGSGSGGFGDDDIPF